MQIKINCNIENVETYTGKNGFGANVTVSQLVNKKRQLLTFNTTNAEVASVLENHLQEEGEITIELNQNNFGLRLGEVLDYTF